MKKTIVQTARARLETNRQTVMEILGYDDLTHNAMVEGFGRAFLLTILLEDGNSFRSIIRHKMYWNWFRNEWSMATARWLVLYQKMRNIDRFTARNSYHEYLKKYFLEDELENEALPSFDNFLKAVTTK